LLLLPLRAARHRGAGHALGPRRLSALPGAPRQAM